MNGPLLQCERITKRFAGVTVLDSVNVTLRAGTVLGLVGENGAGKSTLMNILGGVFPADDGYISLAGESYRPRHPGEAARWGVSIVHQELNLFPNLSIAENLFLNDLPSSFLGLNRRLTWEKSRALLSRVRLDRDPRMLVESLSPGERQLVEIARGLREEAKLLVFDEPTTSLTQPEIERLFEIVDDLRRHGIGIIYISHNLDDVLRLADEIVVLRDGAVHAVGPRADFTVAHLIRAMVGRDIDRLFPTRSATASETAALAVRGLIRQGVLDNVTFHLHRGEVLGVAGLMGSGRTELLRTLFGLDPFDDGEIELGGQRFHALSPAQCIASGMAFLTEDRRTEGLLLDSSMDYNIALASLGKFARFGFLQSGRLKRSAQEMTDALRIAGVRSRSVRTLSGGNQQKTVLAKWLLREPAVLMLDEPTRGVDIGAKSEIYALINRLTAAGTAVLLVSSEIEELLGLCDRIVVMRAGRLCGEFRKDAFEREAILGRALGVGVTT